MLRLRGTKRQAIHYFGILGIFTFTFNYNHRQTCPTQTMNFIVLLMKMCWILGIYPTSATSTTAATLISVKHQTPLISRPPPHQRRKVTTSSTFTRVIVRKRLLAIRVSSLSSGETPEESLMSIQSAIFGNRTTNNNTFSEIPLNATSVVDQYQYISHGQLLWEPVDTTTTQTLSSTSSIDIVGGVFDLNIPNITFTGQSISNLTDIILQQTLKQLTLSSLTDVADHVIFCLPNGSSFRNDPNWTAYTYLNQPYSYYQLSRCTRLSVVVHELGHSLGFQHSGVGKLPYDDKTGYMGYASNQVGYPRKAFNGHKHWISGWFRDRAVVVNPMNGPVEKRLVSFVHYSDSSDRMLDNDTVLIRIGSLYVQYNRAKSYNIDTDMPNTVTITHAIANDDVSDRLAALSVGEMFEYLYTASSTNANQNRKLILQVCSALQYEKSQMDYATIRIYFSDDSNIHDLSDCNKGFISWNSTTAPSVTSNLLESPSSSPIAAYKTDDTIQENDPIVDRDDTTYSNNYGTPSSSSGTNDDNDGRFEGMIYIIVASAMGVILFAVTGYYYVARHIKEQEKIMAIQNANSGKYPQKMEKKVGTSSSSIHPTNQQRRMDVEDLSDTAEDEDDDDERDDALYVLYDAHMLEI